MGQALPRRTTFDVRNGRWVNSNLAEALVPTNSDIPAIEALLIEEDDRRGSALGAKGIVRLALPEWPRRLPTLCIMQPAEGSISYQSGSRK